MSGQGSKFRPRKRSSVSSLLPFARKFSSSDPIDTNNEHQFGGIASFQESNMTTNNDTKSNIAIFITLVVVILYIFSGSLHGHQKLIPIKAGQGNIVETKELIIFPALSSIPYITSGNSKANANGPANKAPGDNANPIPDLGMPPPGSKKAGNQLLAQIVPMVSPIYVGNENPTVVLVLGLDYDIFSPEYLEKIIDNRKHYAMAHGYALYARFVQEFKDDYSHSFSGKSSWAKIPLCRAALLAFPTAKYFWYLDETALIMNPLVDLEESLLNPKSLGSLMIKDVPVVKNSDIIKTFKYTKTEQVQFIISQDDEGLNPISFIFKNSDYSNSLMEYWGEPCHREYKGFVRAETSALNHLSIWHHSILSKIAVVPPRTIAALAVSSDIDRAYSDGDFVAIFDCDSESKACMNTFNKFWNGRGQVKRG